MGEGSYIVDPKWAANALLRRLGNAVGSAAEIFKIFHSWVTVGRYILGR